MATTFDENQLLERVDNDLGFLAETVQMLAGDGRSLVDEIRVAIEKGDAPAVGRSAHALKGMISNFCAPAAQASAFTLERMGKAGDLASAPAAAKELAANVESLISELEAFIRGRTPCAS